VWQVPLKTLSPLATKDKNQLPSLLPLPNHPRYRPDKVSSCLPTTVREKVELLSILEKDAAGADEATHCEAMIIRYFSPFLFLI
jgi:hypothetical protein